jgi:proliferating cell nuclear antigen
MSTPETTPDDTDAQTETDTDAEMDLTTTAGGFACKIDAADLETYLEAYATLVDEMKLNITPEGFTARAVDPANVAMIDETLPADRFEHYSSTGGTIGFNLDRLLNILGMAETGDRAELELDQETRKLQIQLGGLSYTLALIDPDSIRAEPDIPELDLAAEATITGAQFDRGLTAVDMVTDHLTLRVGETDDGEEALVIEGEGDTDDVDLELTGEECLGLAGVDSEAESLFSLDFLKDMNKAIPKSTEVTLRFDDEHPVMIEFDALPNDDDGELPVRFMLAPRIKSE